MTPDDFRALALGLPQSVEKDHFGASSFRVAQKIFAQLSEDGSTGLVKLPLEIQESVVTGYDGALWAEPNWGRHGWTRFNLASTPAELVGYLLLSSWKTTAPRSLHELVSDP